jgi:2-polyprenyl-3-methyl-5-hydroxy-6-metoxy-1,4-benzoquinol methylase
MAQPDGDESVLEARSRLVPLSRRSTPQRILKTVARSLMWPLRRFFDPRFQGIADRVDAKHGHLVSHLNEVLAEIAAVRREGFQRHGESIQRHAESIQLARALADLIGEADGFSHAMRTGSVDDIDEEVARLLNYAGSHVGFAAQRGLWFNPPLSLRYSEGDVVLEETNERIVEVAYVFRALAPIEAGASILDVGAAESTLAFSLASLGYRVTALDVRPYPLAHPSLQTVVASIHDWDHNESFDAVVCLSTIEHIGLSAYDDPAAGEGGDLLAMRRMRELTKPGGLLVLTAPVGRASVNEFQRTYDEAGLEALLEGWDVEDLTVARRQDRKTWVVASKGVESTTEEAGVALVTARRA